MRNLRNFLAEHFQKRISTLWINKIIIIGIWILLWQLIAVLVDNEIMLVTPMAVLHRLFEFVTMGEFWSAILGTLLRISIGFLLGVIGAGLLAFISYEKSIIENILAPIINIFTTIPVAVFTVLILIWWGSSVLAIVICFMVVFPIIYKNVLNGLKSVDIRLKEMAKIYGISNKNKLLYIYRPSLFPFVESGILLALGMSFKAAVAAEVIGTPSFSIGNRLYFSKIYLDTSGVFAWAVVILLLGFICNRLVLWLTRLLFGSCPQKYDVTSYAAGKSFLQEAGADEKAVQGGALKEKELIEITKLFKGYNNEAVIENLSVCYKGGNVYYLEGPSGSGKTTLLRCISGLEIPDSGAINVRGAVSYMFQEDRLCEEYDAFTNVMITQKPGTSKAAIREALCMVLDEKDINKPCSQLSGGMRRRVALVRAMEADAEIILLDEPFNGMDDLTLERVKTYISQKRGDKCVIIATHGKKM